MSKDEHDEWKARFEDAQSSMIVGSHDAAGSAFLDALYIAETGCVSAAELADTLEGLAGTRIRAEKDVDIAGVFDRAETARQHALEETIAEFGDDHLETAEAYYKFAFHNIIRKRPVAAISYLEKTLAIKRTAFGEHHFEVANTLMIMGGTHPDESEKAQLWQRAVAILEHLLANPNKCEADSSKHVPRSLRGGLENLACQAFYENRVADADEYFRRALATCSVTASKRSCTLCNPATFGKVLLAQQKYDECEAFITIAISNGGGFTKRACSEVLADLYDQSGRFQKAQALRDTE
jgi:hypothetical protein